MRIILIIVFVITVVYISMWLASRKRYPVEFGVSFNQNYAQFLGLEWKDAYLAMLNDLRPKFIRIAAMWSEIERETGEFDFTDVDWMMDEAAKRDVKITLVVGQKAPRWPECHVPAWVNGLSADEYKMRLLNYVQQTVKRYKDHPALEIWQVENEPFIHFRFGECANFQEQATRDEIKLVKELDTSHKIMITDSGELSFWWHATRADSDIFGTTIYRVVRTPRGKIFTYDWLPPAFYRWKAKLLGRSMDSFFISELQAEPWFTGSGALETSIEAQKETMDLGRLKKNLDYVKKIGTPRVYLWGVEWWYWMRETQGDGRYWEIMKLETRNWKLVIGNWFKNNR